MYKLMNTKTSVYTSIPKDGIPESTPHCQRQEWPRACCQHAHVARKAALPQPRRQPCSRRQSALMTLDMERNECRFTTKRQIHSSSGVACPHPAQIKSLISSYSMTCRGCDNFSFLGAGVASRKNFNRR